MLVLDFPSNLLQDLTFQLGPLTMHAPIWKQSDLIQLTLMELMEHEDLKCRQHLGKDLLMGDLQLPALHWGLSSGPHGDESMSTAPALHSHTWASGKAATGVVVGQLSPKTYIGANVAMTTAECESWRRGTLRRVCRDRGFREGMGHPQHQQG